MTEIIPDDFNTVRLRLKQLEKRDVIIGDKQDEMLKILWEIKSALDAGERRMAAHSISIKALEDDTDKIRVECKELIREMHESIKHEIAEVAEKVNSKGSVATMWTAMAGAVSGVPAAIYAVYLLFTKGPQS